MILALFGQFIQYFIWVLLLLALVTLLTYRFNIKQAWVRMRSMKTVATAVSVTCILFMLNLVGQMGVS